jgi:hypothetical protein
MTQPHDPLNSLPELPLWMLPLAVVFLGIVVTALAVIFQWVPLSILQRGSL